jgi:hypothetical protein
MQLERQPPRANAEFLRSLLDPDRAEITERSNDVRPNEEYRFVVRLRCAHIYHFLLEVRFFDITASVLG